jgi:hypothetical protein
LYLFKFNIAYRRGKEKECEINLKEGNICLLLNLQFSQKKSLHFNLHPLLYIPPLSCIRLALVRISWSKNMFKNRREREFGRAWMWITYKD